MKLLVDENLSTSLVVKLGDLFPGSVHVYNVDLGSADDLDVWKYARLNGFTVLTKDKDFVKLIGDLGSPPKTVLVGAGNCSTAKVEQIIRSNAIRFTDLEVRPDRSLLFLP